MFNNEKTAGRIMQKCTKTKSRTFDKFELQVRSCGEVLIGNKNMPYRHKVATVGLYDSISYQTIYRQSLTQTYVILESPLRLKNNFNAKRYIGTNNIHT